MQSSERISLVMLFFMAALTQSMAQSVAPLESLKNQYIQDFDKKALRVSEYSSKHAIPIEQLTLEGKRLLVDVVDGIPIFISTLNTGASLTTGVTKIQGGNSGLDLNGDGMLIGVWDAGSVNNHIEFDTRIISNEVNDNDSHATHVTGTLVASGLNSDAKGMAPKASVTNWYFDNDLAEMTALAKPDESSLLISNHSYGTVTGWTKVNGTWSWSGNPNISPDEDFRFGLYGSKAASLDQIANLAPYYTIVWAAGNDRGEPGDGSRPPDCNGGTGYDCIIPEAVAKNIITVGAVNKVPSYTGPSSVAMSSFSSWGPTDDGRIKPDIVGAGVSLFSTSAVGVDTYEFRSGTSMATPNVVGSITLLQELYKKLHGGAVMKSATLKALAIHTAKEAGLLPGPDYSFGWGLMDAEAAAKLLINEDGISNRIYDVTLKNNIPFELTINPIANQKITATIVWNDPAANATPSVLDPQISMLVNDLDIRLIAENGAEYYPWLLDPSNPSAQAIKGNNYRDNVEKLEFNIPEAKPYKLIVDHKGQLVNGSQSFSLILTFKSSLSTANTLYWVGDSGSWEDNTHWSFSSGGAPASILPGANDRIIIDENSFDGVGVDQISMMQNNSVSALKWLGSKLVYLDLDGHTLTINKELTISNSLFTAVGSGIIKCSTSPVSEGKLNFADIDLGSVSLLVDGGIWRLRGQLNSDQLELVSGELEITDSKLDLKNLMANSSSGKSLSLVNSAINIEEQSDLDSNNLLLETTNSQFIVENTTAVLNWTEMNFNDALEIIGANVTINGNNSFGELKMTPGSMLTINGGSNLTVNKLDELQGTLSQPSSIVSSTKSSITLTDHFLLCTDYVNVTNVDLLGQARINLGENSVISNSSNWLTLPCANVLFADFEVTYPCQNGYTEFNDKSLGPVTEWQWDFGDEVSINNTTNSQNSFHGYEADGQFEVQLTISDGQSSHSYTKQIDIAPTSVGKNEVTISSNDLFSVATAPTYQWFLNEQKIDGATSRSFAYLGGEGVYRVVTYDGECNRTSSLVTITGLNNIDSDIMIYPNPVKDVLHVKGLFSSPSQVQLTDVLGRVVYQVQLIEGLSIPVNKLNDGVFVLQVRSNKKTITRKILVKH